MLFSVLSLAAVISRPRRRIKGKEIVASVNASALTVRQVFANNGGSLAVKSANLHGGNLLRHRDRKSEGVSEGAGERPLFSVCVRVFYPVAVVDRDWLTPPPTPLSLGSHKAVCQHGAVIKQRPFPSIATFSYFAAKRQSSLWGRRVCDMSPPLPFQPTRRTG